MLGFTLILVLIAAFALLCIALGSRGRPYDHELDESPQTRRRPRGVVVALHEPRPNHWVAEVRDDDVD